MSFKIVPPQEMSDEKMIAITLGRDISFSRPTAITMLRLSDRRDKVNIFNELLINEEDEPRFRYLAAENLYLLNTADARESLMEASRKVKNPEIQVGIVKSLGRIGKEDALDEILRIKERADGVLLHYAQFAASLLTHRFGLKGHGLSAPEKILGIPPDEATPVDFLHPENDEAELCMKSLKVEPFDMEFSARSMRQLNCRGLRWMLVLNKQYVQVDSFKILKKRKTLLGVMASKSMESDTYSAAYLMLTAPSSDGERVDIFIPRVTGEHGFVGQATPLRGTEAQFEIRSSDQVGIFPMETKGRFTAGGELDLESVVSAVRVKRKRTPKPLK